MFTVDSLERAIRELYRDGVHESDYTESEVESMLDRLNFHDLAQAVRYNARTVYAYTTDGTSYKSFNYRGQELFDQRASRIYEDFDRSTDELCVTDRTYELWFLEDGKLITVSRVTVSYDDGEYITQYREIRGYPWDTDLCLDLEDLAEELVEMCDLCQENEIPVYEL